MSCQTCIIRILPDGIARFLNCIVGAFLLFLRSSCLHLSLRNTSQPLGESSLRSLTWSSGFPTAGSQAGGSPIAPSPSGLIVFADTKLPDPQTSPA